MLISSFFALIVASASCATIASRKEVIDMAKDFEGFMEYLYSTKGVQEWGAKESELREIVNACPNGSTWLDVSQYIESYCTEWAKFALYKYHTWTNS